MILLGIDPGIATTGFGVVQKIGDKMQLIDFGVISTPPKVALDVRLHMIKEDLQEICKTHNPNVCAVEELFFGQNTKTAITVAHARGVILQTLHECGVQNTSFTPIQIKLGVTGYGGADKKQVQEMVRLYLELQANPRQDDAADALAVALCLGQSLDTLVREGQIILQHE